MQPMTVNRVSLTDVVISGTPQQIEKVMRELTTGGLVNNSQVDWNKSDVDNILPEWTTNEQGQPVAKAPGAK